MKRIKQKEGYGKCKFCDNLAVYRGSGWHGHLAPRVCEDHKYLLSEHEELRRDDGHMTEADYQTWGRLR